MPSPLKRRPLLLAGALTVALTALAAFTAPSPLARADAALPFAPGTYTVDKDHTEIGFRVRHLGITNVNGSFGDFDATLEYDPARRASLRSTATVRTRSVDTGNARRDEHLRSADFFDVARFPTMTFQSTAIRNVRGDRFQLAGNLTLHGVTRPVVLDAEVTGTARDPMGNERVAFEAETTIDREDFGLTWNQALEAGGLLVSKDVKILLEVQAVRQG